MRLRNQAVEARIRAGAKRSQALLGGPLPSALEAEFALQLRLAGLPRAVTEMEFAGERGFGDGKARRFRFDFAWPEARLAVEIEGGFARRRDGSLRAFGRHSRGDGFARDCVKYNTAALLGWRVLRFTGPMVKSGEAMGWVGKALKAEGAR